MPRSQVRPRAARIAEVGERPFDSFAPQPLQATPAIAVGVATIATVRLLSRRGGLSVHVRLVLAFRPRGM